MSDITIVASITRHELSQSLKDLPDTLFTALEK